MDMIVILLLALILVLQVVLVLLCLRSRKDREHDRIDATLDRKFNSFRDILDTKLENIGDVIAKSFRDGRSESNMALDRISDSLRSGQAVQTEAMSRVERSVRDGLVQISSDMSTRLSSMQDSHDTHMAAIQATVDEKLQKTLNDRLTASFSAVSDQLQAVSRGLGEMQGLANDTRALKNALTNVKSRGTYGEVRCEKLLSDILAPGQYETNVQIQPGCFVEFAVKLPGSGDGPVLLPIDSKFPIEDYNRLLDAEDKASIDTARKSLRSKILLFAKDIHDKYILPPKTTDFAVMFLPTEGLYAEIVRDVSLFEELRVKYSIMPVGMTTLSAFLSSLQIGFKTLAIEKRSQEVQMVLEAVKAEISKFGGMLEKAQKQVQQADATLSNLAGTRLNALNRKLRSFDTLPEKDAEHILGLVDATDQAL
mgnify:FL=1